MFLLFADVGYLPFVMLKFQIVLVKRFMFAILKCSMFSSLNLISNPFFAD